MVNHSTQRSSPVSIAAGVMVFVIALILIISMFVFYVYEGERVLVQRFGQLKVQEDGSAFIYQPGIHFYIPFIDTVRRINIRLQMLSVPSDRIYTKEQKTVTVDYFALWRVVDIPKFFLRTTADYEKAKFFLRSKINDTLRVEIGKRDVNEVITGQRGDIIETLKQKSDEAARYLGVEIEDVRMSRVDYPQEVSESVFQRMRAAREKEAGMYRSEGDEESEVIRAKGDADRITILAKANEKSAVIRAEGDAEAAAIYNKSYEKSEAFFDLIRSLDLYKSVIKENETMLIDLKASKVFSPLLDANFAK